MQQWCLSQLLQVAGSWPAEELGSSFQEEATALAQSLMREMTWDIQEMGR